MAQLAQIELLVPLECAFNCASIGAIDIVIGCSIVPSVCTVLLKHCFEIRRVLLRNDWKVFIPSFPYTLVITRLVDTPTDQQSRP